jgi:hypothetical protein
LLWLVALSVAVPLASYRINAFGQFGDARGLSRRVFGNEREAKYLLCRNYVPANYDTILLGSSSSDNWPTELLTSVHAYNASVNGGDITEAAILADASLRSPHVRTVILVLSPYLLIQTGRKTGFMTEADYWSSLGSSQLLYDYLTLGLQHLHVLPDRYRADGSDDFTRISQPPRTEGLSEPQLRDLFGMKDKDWVAVPEARAELRELLQRIRTSGKRLVTVFIPLRPERMALRSKENRAFIADMAALGAHGDVVVDFTAPPLDALGRNSENFFDAAHLNAQGAERVMRALDQELRTRLR